MGNVANAIAPPTALMLRYAEMLLAGIEPKQFARLAPGAGGKPIQSNHPAFAFGHLCLYPRKAAAMLGSESAVAPVPAGFEEVFSAKTQCRDDPEGRIYPPMKTITEYFFRSHKEAVNVVAAADDAAFAKPLPDAKMLTTVGAAVAFYMGGHAQMHLGQVSAWRRAMGMPSAM